MELVDALSRENLVWKVLRVFFFSFPGLGTLRTQSLLNLLSKMAFWFVDNYVLTCKECDFVFGAYQLKVQCVTFTGMNGMENTYACV